MSAEEMAQWLKESGQMLVDVCESFSVFVDMRTLVPLDTAGQAFIGEGQRLYKRAGMERSVVILKSPVIVMQFKQIAISSGICDYERYIDASAEPSWEQIGLDWILNGVDPDKKQIAKAPSRHSVSERPSSPLTSALSFLNPFK